jgi:hypothetical protein
VTPASIPRPSRREWLAALAALWVGVLWVGVLCALPAAAPMAVAAPAPASASTPALGTSALGTPRLLVDNGARAAWSPSRRRQHIAFDAVVDDNNRNMAVFTVDTQGGQRTCITCGTAVPNGFVGMMDWLPDGRHLLVSAENEHSQHRRFNQPSFGIDNDLWLVSADGKRVERIWRSPHRGGAVLNARVDRRGKLLFFAERVPTGTQLPTALRQFGAWGEDVWAGWQLHVAEIDLRKRGEAVLRNHRVLQPNGPGFYESSGFTPDGGMLYAYSAPGHRFSDDVWHIARERAAPVNLTDRADSWDEHGLYSPDRRWFGYVSSRFEGGLRYPGADNAELATELYLQRRDAPALRATAFNLPAAGTDLGLPAAGPAVGTRMRRVVSRITFSPDSRRVLMQVTQADRTAPAQLWVLDLPR